MTHRHSTGFDRLAPYYDRIARLVYGEEIVKAQTTFLACIPEGARVLILGGGTGWILNAILENSNPGDIWYVDSSPAMVERARKKYKSSTNVYFVTGTLDDISATQKFDFAITTFYLDLYSDERLSDHVEEIAKRLNRDAHWLVSDFTRSKKIFHRFLLWMMYRFFKAVCRIEASMLPRWEEVLQTRSMNKVAGGEFYNGFIKTILYRL